MTKPCCEKCDGKYADETRQTMCPGMCPCHNQPWQEIRQQLISNYAKGKFNEQHEILTTGVDEMVRYISELLQREREEGFRLKTIGKANSYEMGFTAGYKAGREDCLAEIKHEQDKLFNGFAHPKDCVQCRVINEILNNSKSSYKQMKGRKQINKEWNLKKEK